MEDVEGIKLTVKNHFENFFTETNHSRPVPELLPFSCLTDQDRAIMEFPFSVSEIKDAIWSCNGSKSAWPNDFSFEFLQNCWEFIKGDIVTFVNDIHARAKLIKGCITSFIALIPKVNNHQSLSKYPPISLVGCLQKILSKFLASWLKNVTMKQVSIEQLAFIAGRNIYDKALMVNEIIDMAKRDKNKFFALKLISKKHLTQLDGII